MGSTSGLYIVVDGAEGCGKSTQVERLLQAMVKAGIDAEYVREPGSTPLSQDIRNLLLDTDYQMSSYEELCLFSAARSVLFRTTVIDLLNSAGKLVLADRSYPSTWAYQYYAGDGTASEEIVLAMTHEATQGYRYDLLIVLDVDLKTSKERKRLDKLDRIESKGPDYHRKVHEGFRQYVRHYPESSVLIDARQSEEDVFSQICKVIRDRFGIELDPAV